MLSRILKPLLFGLLVGITGLILSFFGFTHELEEDTGLGLLFKLRGPRPAPAEAVVVSIDKDSADQLKIPDNPDKWPRSLHARLVEVLSNAGASVVTFDVHFIEARVDKDDKAFAAALKKAANVVLGDALTAKEISTSTTGGSDAPEHSIVKITKPYAPLAESAVATVPFVLPRIPFKVNKYWTFQPSTGDAPTFPIVAFQLFNIRFYKEFVGLLEKISPNHAGKLPRDADSVIQSKGIVKLMRDIREIYSSDPSIGMKMLSQLDRSDSTAFDESQKRGLKLLVDLYAGSNRRYLNYYGPPRTVTTIPYYQALQMTDNPNGQKPFDLKGKAVFVGLSERLLAERKDSFYTVFSQANGLFIGGVEIAATAFLNLLEDASVKPIDTKYYLLTILLWGILMGVICRASSILLAAASALGLSILYFIFAQSQFKLNGTWFPIVIPLFAQSPLALAGAVLWSYVETNKERQQIRKALAYYVPDEVVDQLAKNMVDIKNSGSMVYGACLFADVAGYTTLSEKMTPQQLSDLMHKYFEATFEPVKRHGGMVVNLKGDSFLAIWKAAGPDDRLRRQACSAALDVAKAVHRFNGTVANLDLPTRVGVHSGEIFIGNIGAGDHYEYGPTGDTVNTASRMDGLNKYLGTEVLVSGEAIANLNGLAAREVGTFMLKGKALPIVVHELLGSLEDNDDRHQQSCELFNAALSAFKRRSWDEAEAKFRRAVEIWEADGPAHFYLKLCDEYKSNPPGETWNGVIVLDEK